VKGWSGATITHVEAFVIVSGTGDDKIVAGAGDDTIYDYTGDDTLVGGNGNDTIIDFTGKGTLLGGTGDDILANTSLDSPGYSSSIDTINGGAGNDTVTLATESNADLTFNFVSSNKVTKLVGDGTTVVNVENFNFYGGAGNVRFTAGDGNDYLSGGARTNVLRGGGGDDELHGDRLQGATSTLNGGDGNDTITGGYIEDTLIGGNGDDMLALHGKGAVYGGEGTDQLLLDASESGDGLTFDAKATSATSELRDIDGNLLVSVTGVESYIILASGTITGGDGNDTIIGHGTLSGGNGDDTLQALGSAVMDGGAGNDTGIFLSTNTGPINFRYAGPNAVTTEATTGTTFVNIENFHIEGGQGDDVMVAGGGNDTLVGSFGNNTLNGGAGDDFLQALNGNDKFIGGSGIDTVSFNDPFFFASVTADLTTGKATGDGTDRLSGIENLTGGYFNDVLTGDDGNNVLDGGLAVFGGTPVFSYDVLNGGAGDDTLVLQKSGWGALDGGDGNDTAVIDDSGSITLAVTFEFLGSAETTVMYDGAFADYRVTGVENFQIQASQVNDTLTTGAGADKLTGNAGDDSLTSNAGDDILNGGRGADVLTSGSGFDTFVYAGAAESTNAGFDTVVGFNTHFDHFQLPTAVTAIDAAISGSLDADNFTTSLQSTIGASALGAHHALLFNVTGGAYAGKTFLIVDGNGEAGYQDGADYVIALQSATNLADLGVGNFTVG
jgi:Ca2+-binding RTX toxin-like protein